MTGSSFLFHPSNGGGFQPFAHLGHAAAVAYDPRAPLDETADADRQILATYGRDPVGILGGPDVMAMIAEFAAEQRENGSRPRAMRKALQYGDPKSVGPKAHASSILSRLGGAQGGQYNPKPGIPFSGLRYLAKRIEIVQAILRQRQRQLLSFCEPAKLDSEPGWMLGAADQDAELGDDHKEFLSWLQQFLLCGGRRFDPLGRRIGGNEDFRTFLAKFASDSLTLDHAAIETVPLRGALGLDSFFLRDSATFYLAADPMREQGIYAYQDLAMGEQVDFKFEDLAIVQRNPQTDLEWCGYAYGELEAGLDTISTVLSAFANTKESLDNNAIPRGIMLVSGNYDPASWQQFETAWRQKIRGAANAHGLPVLRSGGQQGNIQYVPTGAPVSEMVFAKWISLQVAILTSLYGMDPTEIGMEAFSAGNTSSLGGSDTGERLAAAKDKGLRPFLRDISAAISDHLVSRFTKTPWARFRFTGVNAQDEALAEAERSRLATTDELRAKHGMKPHPLPWIGALPADPGMQSAEFTRFQAVATVGEGRAAWGGLPAYPDAIVNSAPLNPSMQSAYNMALQAAAGEAQADTIDPDAAKEDGPEPPADGFGADVHSRLARLSAPPEEGEEEGQDA